MEPEFVWDLGSGPYEEDSDNAQREEETWGRYTLWIRDIRNALSRPQKVRGFWVLVGDNSHVIATVIFRTIIRLSFAIHRTNAYIYSYRIKDTTYYFKDAPVTDVYRFPGTTLVKLPFSSRYPGMTEKNNAEPTFGLEGIQIAAASLFHNPQWGKMIFVFLHVIAESLRFNYFERIVMVASELPDEAVIRNYWGKLCERIQEADENNMDEFDKPLQIDGSSDEKVIGSISESRVYVSMIKVVSEPTEKQKKGKMSR